MALISKGIKLYYKAAAPGPTPYPTEILDKNTHETYGWDLLGLQEIGELSSMGGGVTRDKIEVTTLADDKHVYAEGLITESDASGITFKFLFEPELFTWFGALQENIEQYMNSDGHSYTRESVGHWHVVLPDGTTFKMHATITDAKLDGAGVGAALTMTVTLTPFMPIKVTAPSYQM